MSEDLSLYIHIPFCVRKCLYCDFPSYGSCENIYGDYVNSLIRELKEGSRIYDGFKINTVFMGGGTPTVLESRDLGRIMDTVLGRFDVADNAEITCEANPGTLDFKKLTEMRSMEINRLSMGVQAWQDRILQMLGRIHDNKTFIDDMAMAKDAGFKNINCDLMFALPNQKIDDWQETLEKVIKLNPQHISAYSLIIEEGTPFKKMYDEGKIKPADEETDRKMYYLAKEILADNGYHQYEISNFAKEGFAYTGLLQIVKVMMNYDYLWQNIRVLGGAYGCMSAFGRGGDTMFVSYRDPKLAKTNEVYDGIPAYLEQFEADEREMTKYIIGTISELDTPLTPSMKGSRSLNAYFCEITEEEVQKERDEILNATCEQIRALASQIRAVLDQQNLCVIGNEQKIRESKELFERIAPLC